MRACARARVSRARAFTLSLVEYFKKSCSCKEEKRYSKVEYISQSYNKETAN